MAAKKHEYRVAKAAGVDTSAGWQVGGSKVKLTEKEADEINVVIPGALVPVDA